MKLTGIIFLPLFALLFCCCTKSEQRNTIAPGRYAVEAENGPHFITWEETYRETGLCTRYFKSEGRKPMETEMRFKWVLEQGKLTLTPMDHRTMYTSGAWSQWKEATSQPTEVFLISEITETSFTGVKENVSEGPYKWVLRP